ncbi:hypothetical protein BJ322DRAFT_229181 [Thelephora terrestris]|uniref:DUF6533 domain-containing protein n=1 Tax=Thelephora terrestris TaxID=56493 RepID=A0A9P6H837_9AGAM|nr:hypothetical protein BJ322DRAFT_229181 [Thelephora terrestris]
MDPAALTQAGEQLFEVKLLLTAVQYLWIYDYLLTLGDEIRYAWSGRKSWVFGLFIANRYTPLIHLIWAHITMFHFEKPLIYAITRRHKLLGGALALVIVVEICNGIFSIFWIASGPLAPLPDIDLDAFKICIHKNYNVGKLIYYITAMVFDVLAFSIIVVTARRSRMYEYPTMPSILNTILRDATFYFILIFSAHFLSTLLLFVAPESVQLMPAMANTIFVPVMASRLMLSLKKAAVGSTVEWSLDTMTNARSAEDRTICFAPRVPGGLHELSLTSTAPNEEDTELGTIPQPPRNSK